MINKDYIYPVGQKRVKNDLNYFRLESLVKKGDEIYVAL